MKTKCLIIAQYDFISKKGKEIKSGKALVNLGVYGVLEVTSDKLFGQELFKEISCTIDVDPYGKLVIVSIG